VRITVELQGIGKAPPPRWRNTSLRYQPIKRLARGGRRTKLRDGPIAIGHDQTLAFVDEAKVLAEILPQLCYTHRRHVHKSSRSRVPTEGQGRPNATVPHSEKAKGEGRLTFALRELRSDGKRRADGGTRTPDPLLPWRA
jgi:hypothetical protein